jgi:hypothetical protein
MHGPLNAMFLVNVKSVVSYWDGLIIVMTGYDVIKCGICVATFRRKLLPTSLGKEDGR